MLTFQSTHGQFATPFFISAICPNACPSYRPCTKTAATTTGFYLMAYGSGVSDIDCKLLYVDQANTFLPLRTGATNGAVFEFNPDFTVGPSSATGSLLVNIPPFKAFVEHDGPNVQIAVSEGDIAGTLSCSIDFSRPTNKVTCTATEDGDSVWTVSGNQLQLVSSFSAASGQPFFHLSAFCPP
jgi:hypothetical protein